MNEKMREMVGKGELSEASYKNLVDELGRQKEEADAPLFVVTYTANMIIARVRSDGVVPFQTDRHIAPLPENDVRPRALLPCQTPILPSSLHC